jgi:hypothetical protein
MAGTTEQKTFWGLGEMVMWIRTRDHEQVCAISHLSEPDAMAPAMFAFKTRLDRSLLRFSVAEGDTGQVASELPSSGEASVTDGEPAIIGWAEALDDLFRKIRSGRIAMRAIKWHRNSNEQTQIPSGELNDLQFRFVPEFPVAPVGLWSRSLDTLCWRSPQFSRADALRLWPARRTKTAAVSTAILRHLTKIMIPEAPLTKAEARQRCLTEIADFYPAAFAAAWAKLDPSFKRGRGKHGPRRG